MARSSWASGVNPDALARAGIPTQPGDFGSDLEGAFSNAAHHAGLPTPEREVELVPGRKWRCDFVWRSARLIVECEGGTYSGGRHTRGKGFEDDCRKYAHLTLLGYRVLRITEAHIKSGEAVRWVEWGLEGAS